MKTSTLKINFAKVAIFAICFVCATCAFSQSAPVLINTPQPIQIPDHVLHASDHAMATESSLFSAASPYTYAKGEVPLAELGSIAYQTPLGDVARAYRKEHSTAPKATIVLEK
jgi:hypothetical protein